MEKGGRSRQGRTWPSWPLIRSCCTPLEAWSLAKRSLSLPCACSSCPLSETWLVFRLSVCLSVSQNFWAKRKETDASCVFEFINQNRFVGHQRPNPWFSLEQSILLNFRISYLKNIKPETWNANISFERGSRCVVQGSITDTFQTTSSSRTGSSPC